MLHPDNSANRNRKSCTTMPSTRNTAHHYPLPARVLIPLAASMVANRSRSFRHDALACVGQLDPPLEVLGCEYIPPSGPCLITVNHYSRPGFPAWWITFAVSAAVPIEIHWISTAAWTFPGRWYRRPARRASEWVLERLARVYGFTTMPPMPPDPAEVQVRTQAVRQVLTRVRQTSDIVVGLAPEGRDMPNGQLGWPPAGAGRFITHLASLGLEIAPVGVYEESDRLCASFGPRYRLDSAPGVSADERDRTVSRIVMEHIAAQMPARLRGEFDGSPTD